MSSKLQTFLNQFKRTQADKDNGTPPTHTWLVDPKYTRTFVIPPEKYDELYDLIYESVFIKNEQCHLVERFRDPCMLKVDFDFVFENDTTTRQYGQKEIKDIVKIYNKVITTFIDVPTTKLNTYVFERKRGYHDKGKFKDGFHMVYPEIVINAALQRIIRKKVLDKIGSVLDRLKLQTSYDETVDESIIDRNGWMMYGTNKTSRKPYLLTHIYDIHSDDIFDPNEVDNRALIEHLSLYRNEIKDSFDIIDKYKDLLDTIGSKKKNNQNGTAKKSRSRKGRAGMKFKNKENFKDLDTVRKLVDILDPYRADDYQKWISVGLCLHNISDTLLDSWIKFSKKSSKYIPGECEEKWLDFAEEAKDKLSIGMGSLHHFTRLDDPVGYETVKRGSINKFMEVATNGTSDAVANLVHEMYKYHFVCTSIKHSTWYEFRNHRWREVEKGYTLQSKLSGEVLNEYLSISRLQCDQAIDACDDSKTQLVQRLKKLADVTMKLQDITFKDKVMKECSHKFYDVDFFDKLDKHPDLLGFENGVLNLKTSEFRDGYPEDYISLSVGYDYLDLDKNDPAILDIDKYMEQVFPVEAVREYAWRALSSFLYGANKDQKFHIWEGVGSNSKSLLIDFFCMALGEYAGTLPISLLTQKRGSSSSASPELAQTRGLRFVYMQEPDRGQKMNIGLMKELTGGDKFLCRPLYKEPFMLTPQFKIVLCCNDLPKVPPDDGGTWRRIRLLKFIAKFLDNPNPNAPYEFKIDRTLKDRMEDHWREAFMFKLIAKYQDYLKEGLNEPKEVMAATEGYQKQADVTLEFLDDNIIDDPKGRISLDEFWYKFQSWYSNNYTGQKRTITSKAELKTHLIRKLDKPDKLGWDGYRWLSPHDDLERRKEIDGEDDESILSTNNPKEFDDATPEVKEPKSNKISLKKQISTSIILKDAKIIDETSNDGGSERSENTVVQTASSGPLKLAPKKFNKVLLK
jgi:P4 family phage/plasmid primase-like protien